MDDVEKFSTSKKETTVDLLNLGGTTEKESEKCNFIES